MQKKVRFMAYASNGAENLYMGTAFEECLLEYLKRSKEYGLEEEMMILTKHLKENKSNMRDEYLLNNLFRTEIFLDFDISLRFRRLDIISGEVFRYKTDIGKAMKALLEYSEMKFVLEKRDWINENEVSLYFEATHGDFDSQCVINIRNGKYQA